MLHLLTSLYALRVNFKVCYLNKVLEIVCFEHKIPKLTFVSHRKISLNMETIESYDQTYHQKVEEPHSYKIGIIGLRHNYFIFPHFWEAQDLESRFRSNTCHCQIFVPRQNHLRDAGVEGQEEHLPTTPPLG